MKNIKKILKQYGYIVTWKALHTQADIKNYKRKKDAIDEKKYMTILTADGHVVGRVFDIWKSGIQQDLSKENINEIMGMFSMFDIPHDNKILSALEQCCN